MTSQQQFFLSAAQVNTLKILEFLEIILLLFIRNISLFRPDVARGTRGVTTIVLEQDTHLRKWRTFFHTNTIHAIPLFKSELISGDVIV